MVPPDTFWEWLMVILVCGIIALLIEKVWEEITIWRFCRKFSRALDFLGIDLIAAEKAIDEDNWEDLVECMLNASEQKERTILWRMKRTFGLSIDGNDLRVEQYLFSKHGVGVLIEGNKLTLIPKKDYPSLYNDIASLAETAMVIQALIPAEFDDDEEGGD